MHPYVHAPLYGLVILREVRHSFNQLYLIHFIKHEQERFQLYSWPQSLHVISLRLLINDFTEEDLLRHFELLSD